MFKYALTKTNVKVTNNRLSSIHSTLSIIEKRDLEIAE